MNSAAFAVLTNKLNNLSADEANKVIDYVNNVNNDLIDKARTICGEYEDVNSFIIYSSKITYIKVECGDYVDEKKIVISDILNC